jgi:short-subunit dehydrogenase
VLCPGFVRTDFHKRNKMDRSAITNNRFISWMLPDEVVRISIKNLKKKNKVYIIPGFWNKTVKRIYDIMPRRIFYSLAKKFLV